MISDGNGKRIAAATAGMGSVSPEKVRKAADRLRRLCSRREYCSSDMMKKALQALDGDSGAAREMVCALEKEKYVDDSRYACSYARDKSSIAGWGTSKIRYMLASKGIARDIIDGSLQQLDSVKSDARMLKLMECKYKALKDDPQCRLKMLRYALGRGYSYEQAESALRNVMKGE